MFKILLTRFNKSFDLSLLDLMTDFTKDKLILNFSAVETIALVSLGKHDPP